VQAAFSSSTLQSNLRQYSLPPRDAKADSVTVLRLVFLGPILDPAASAQSRVHSQAGKDIFI
jgi:hypothetical protein